MPAPFNTRRQLLVATSVAAGAWALGPSTLVRPALAESAESLKSRFDPAPALSLQDVDGKQHDLASHAGKIVLINFWATWCAPCVAEMPALQRLRDRHPDRIAVLAVNYGETVQRVQQFRGRMNLNLPLLLDPWQEAREAWKARFLPVTYVVDTMRTIRFEAAGEREWTSAAITAQLLKLHA